MNRTILFTPRSNFKDILHSMMNIFQILIGDGWNLIWYQSVLAVGGAKANSFFVVLLILGKFLFMNSFISLILFNFEEVRNEA